MIKIERATSETAKNLGIEADDEVIHFQRLRIADDSPMAFEEGFLPAKRFPDLEKTDLRKNSLYRVLESEYGVKISHAEEVMEAVSVNPEIARLLSIKEGSPALMVQRIAYSESETAVESVKTIYRADRYRATYVLRRK